jgi:hypothetical protein
MFMSDFRVDVSLELTLEARSIERDAAGFCGVPLDRACDHMGRTLSELVNALDSSP